MLNLGRELLLRLCGSPAEWDLDAIFTPVIGIVDAERAVAEWRYDKSYHADEQMGLLIKVEPYRRLPIPGSNHNIGRMVSNFLSWPDLQLRKYLVQVNG